MQHRTLHGRRILVVEDDSIIAMDLRHILETAGAAVIGPAYKLDTAHRLIDCEAFDAAVLDVRLGRENTLPLADLLLARGIPFLFQTSDPGLVAGLYPGVTVLRKPFCSEQLVAALAAVLAQV
jgi:DNA-binding response OmpR family regulator